MLTVDIRVNGAQVAVVEIRNDGTGNAEIGNYDVALIERGRITRRARVEEFDRSRGSVDLAWFGMDAVRDEPVLSAAVPVPEVGWWEGKGQEG